MTYYYMPYTAGNQTLYVHVCLSKCGHAFSFTPQMLTIANNCIVM